MSISETVPDRPIASHLIGVIDLRGGLAVHAVAGQRANYQVIDRDACPAGSPSKLATAYLCGAVRTQVSTDQSSISHALKQSQLVCRAGLYVADLDAIIDGKDSSHAAIADIVAVQTQWNDENPLRNRQRLFLDCGMVGLAGIEQLKVWSDQLDLHVVIGTESIGSTKQFLHVYNSLRDAGITVVISVDLKAGKLLSGCAEFEKLRAIEVIDWFVPHGLNQFIVLDLAAVGTSSGPSTLPICQQAAAKFRQLPDFRLISGGGLRNEADVQQFIAAGCDAVLVATWLQKFWQ